MVPALKFVCLHVCHSCNVVSFCITDGLLQCILGALFQSQIATNTNRDVSPGRQPDAISLALSFYCSP